MTERRRVLEWGAAAALLVAFGRFLASNIILRSDYLWFIGVLFALAVLTISCFVGNTRGWARGDRDWLELLESASWQRGSCLP